MMTPQTAPVTRAIHDRIRCQPVSSGTTLCIGDIVTIIVISIVFILALSCIFWTWRIVHRHAIADQEQASSNRDPYNVVSPSLDSSVLVRKGVVREPYKPVQAKTAGPDVFWSPQAQLPELKFHLDPLPTMEEMTEMRNNFSIRPFSCHFPSSPSPRSSLVSLNPPLLQSQSFGGAAHLPTRSGSQKFDMLPDSACFEGGGEISLGKAIPAVPGDR
ncbi:uncharacterized protein F5147DRAFT_701100 [Suillus discolor]|uniref:Uncharacterized protein n=1 Tax=Suillus discolor TaxID=1912936 RepID=A0A9P7JTB5_9AGAM|nr:uncharacterized protein F5147DRAFT_719769 [Suillus discolor]XP_041291703.1 uncharacterized protein F5147DRAFT_701100 [Suillus discolor]KAG2094449.1 hypothetical protein F5147DRAFT_719769 [Suillus discolor]KAG2106665.1 hypothetical protein F5147DRAFT_701100 [Suillus discolor]